MLGSQDVVYSIKSFIVLIYDGNFQELRRYHVPIGVAAPFANRLFEEMLSHTTVHEPWYSLEPRYEVNFVRSLRPVGATSLYGKRYEPAKECGPLIQLHPGAFMRSLLVRLLDFQTTLYEGEYSVDDLFLAGAHYLLKNGLERGQISANKGPYYYAMLASTTGLRSLSTDFFPEDAYEVEGVFRLPPQVRDGPRIVFRKVPQPPFEVREPLLFGSTAREGKGVAQKGQVFIPQAIYEQLREQLQLSHYLEEGGYLLGHVYRAPGSPADEEAPDFRWVVEITDVIMAEDTVGSAATLLFTGNSWSKISRRRARDFPQHKLIGWFHTHLFAATDSFGLSGLDQDMHAWYLPKAWQIALLLNLEADGEWTLRCYQRGAEGDLVETPFEVISEQ